MAVESLLAPGTVGRYSGRVWQNVPFEAIKAGVVRGSYHEWDMGDLKPSSNVNAAEAYWDKGAMVFGSNGAALAYFAGTGLDNGMTFSSDGDNEGATFRAQNVSYQIARSTKAFAAEVELETSTITDTKHGFFWGLLENTAGDATHPIAADGTLADENLVGFHRLEGDGDKLDLVYKANGVTQVTVLADAVTLAADTPIRLGMTFNIDKDPAYSASRYVFRWWADGALIAGTSYKVIPSADGTDFPNDVAMGPIFALLNATATTPGNTTVHRMRFAQLW